MTRLRVVPLVCAVALPAVGGWVAGQVFAGSGWVLPVLAAAVVPAVVGVAVASARGRVLGALAGLGALALLLALGVAPGRELLSGGRQLLTGALPLEAGGGPLAAVVLGTGVGTLASLLLVTGRRPAAAAVPGLLALAAALAVSASSGPPPAAAVAAAALALGGLLASERPASLPGRAAAGRTAVLRRGVPAVALLAVAVGVATTVAGLPAASPRDERADARSLVTVPVEVRTSTSPLARFAGLAGEPDRRLAVVRGDVPGRLRLATLDRFDGEGWTSSAVAVRAGRVLPAPPAGGPPAVTATVEVELLSRDLFDFLPAPGRPVEVSLPGLAVQPATGDLVVPAGRDVPSRYTVTAAEPDLRATALAAVRAVRVPPLEVPPELARQARERAVGAGDFARLAALEQSLADGTRAEQDPLPSGSGLFQVTRLLDQEVGTDEQYASAFAVLAGSLGYDTRVVVGFRPAPRGEGPAAEADLLGGGITAWPEVQVERVGWLPFAPTPVDAQAAPDPSAGSPEDVVRRAVQESVDAPPAPPPTTAPPPPAQAPDGRGNGADLALGAVVLVVLAVLAGALAVPLLRARRRRRRRAAAAPSDRVLGAWHDAVDLLVVHRRARRGGTSGDVVRGCGLPDPARDRLSSLAELADRAAYSGQVVAEDDAAAAWQARHAVGRCVRQLTPRRARLVRALDPRTLR